MCKHQVILHSFCALLFCDIASRGRHSKDKCMFVLYLQAISVITNKGLGGGSGEVGGADSSGSSSSHGPHMEFSTKVSISLVFCTIARHQTP